MKTKFKFLIGAATMVAASTFMIPLLTSCSKNDTTNKPSDNNDNNNDSTNKPSDDNNSNSTTTFVDNTQDYVDKISNSAETSFNPNEEVSDWLDFKKLSNNPNDEIYNNIYNSITKEVIENDINNFIKTLGEKNDTYNFGFKTKIKNISINNLEGNWDIKIEFDVYNNLSKNNTFKIGNLDSINFEPKSTKNIELNFGGQLQKTFYNSTLKGNNKSYFGYYFPNAALKVDNTELKFENFKLSDYSWTLNKFVEINSSEVGYTDIANFANEKLNTLTQEDIQNEIKYSFDVYVNSIGELLDPVQNLLQNLVLTKTENKTVIQFLSENSENIGVIVDTLYKLISKDDSLNLKDPIQFILADKKLSEILVNEPTKNLIMSLITKLAPDLAPTINSILANVNEDNVQETVEQLLFLLETMLPSLVPSVADKDISPLINSLKNEGLLTAIINNKQLIISILSDIPGIKDNEIAQMALVLIGAIELNETNIFDLIINIIKYQDPEGNIVLKELLNKALPNSTITSLLSQLVFDNENLNSDNLAGLVDMIANPKDSKNGQTIRWKEWFDAINIVSNFTTNENGNIIHTYKFEFGKNIYINIDKIYKILPKNLTIGTTSIPTSLLSTALPSWISINAGDYVEITQNFDAIEYDVINVKGAYKLSWQSFAKTTIDMNMPQTLKTIYDTSLGAGGVLVTVLNNIFYHKFDTSGYFKPYQSSLGSNVINNYNPNSKNNQAIFTNTIAEDKLIELQTKLNESIVEETIEGSEYVISKGIFGIGKVTTSKKDTTSSFNVEELLAEYFNLEYYSSKYHISFDVNNVIRKDSILGFEIPSVTTKNISISTPYNVYTNDGAFKSYYTIKI